MYLIGLAMIIFVGYLISLDIKDNAKWFKELKNKRRIKKLKSYKNERLSKHHPDYWMWNQGDALVYNTGEFEALAILKTFSDSFVIAEDLDAHDEITLYGRQIIENESARKRVLTMEAKKFQTDVLPSLIEDNMNDMKLLSEVYETTKQKMLTR